MSSPFSCVRWAHVMGKFSAKAVFMESSYIEGPLREIFYFVYLALNTRIYSYPATFVWVLVCVAAGILVANLFKRIPVIGRLIWKNGIPSIGYRDADRGHILENIVFLELIRCDYRVYIGKVGEREVDFVAEKPNDKLYIQVTESMQSPETRERELKPLRMMPDNYEKIVLSMDRNYITSYDGIKSLYLIDWLLS